MAVPVKLESGVLTSSQHRDGMTMRGMNPLDLVVGAKGSASNADLAFEDLDTKATEYQETLSRSDARYGRGKVMRR